MKGKTMATFALGATTGFVAGGIFVVKKAIRSKSGRDIIAHAIADALTSWLFGEEGADK